MSPTTPFRSHLLQQWTQQGRRPPAAAMPWLRPAPSSNPDREQQQQQRHHSSHHRRHSTYSRENKHYSPRPNQYHSSPSSSSINRKCSGNSVGSPELSVLPSLYSIDDSSFQSSFSRITGLQHYHTSTAASRNYGNGLISSDRTRSESMFSAAAFSAESKPSDQKPPKHGTTPVSKDGLSHEMQQLLLSRQTAAKPLVHSTKEDSSRRQEEIGKLRFALNKAVQAAMMAPNHKRTEPFSFKRIWAHSHAAATLADICYQVTLRKKQLEPLARKKKEKWAQIPAFLVALVHQNQAGVEMEGTTEEHDSYSPLKFSPPMTERQLEDYASASAAIQNAMLSLHAEGIATKWATGPVIQTQAFRKLVQAEPTDRVAGLVMIGGWNSAKLSEREEKMAEVRRHRRRELRGDVLQDLS